MTVLDAEHTIQASPVMAGAVASLHSWISGETTVCVVVAPTGAGKSHLLSATARTCMDALVMPPADGSDCTVFLDGLRSGNRRQVIADDLDKLPKKLCEEIIKRVALNRHQFLASVSELTERLRNFLSAKWSELVVVTITNPSSRAEDVGLFVARWLESQQAGADECALSDCARFCTNSDLPNGFRTVDAFLTGLAENGWDFSGPLRASDAAGAYYVATKPPPSKPAVLVEGYTERIYFDWLLASILSIPAVEVRDCDGASNVVQQAISIRNQGRSCVSVLDSDDIGKEKARQLKEYGHPVVLVPVTALSLPMSAFDHVKKVAEIEDLLPVDMVERFLCECGKQPELEIRSPNGVRYVIGEAEKRTLAKWVVKEADRESVPKLFKLLAEALSHLGINV